MVKLLKTWMSRGTDSNRFAPRKTEQNPAKGLIFGALLERIRSLLDSCGRLHRDSRTLVFFRVPLFVRGQSPLRFRGLSLTRCRHRHTTFPMTLPGDPCPHIGCVDCGTEF